MAGLFSNPANWQITDSLQGQRGGINPFKAWLNINPIVKAGDAIKDSIESRGYGSPNTVYTSNAGTTATNSSVLGDSTDTPWSGGVSSGSGSGRNSSGYYGDYTSDQVNNLNSQLGQTDRLLASLGVTRDTGLQNIGSEYSKNVGRAQEGQNQFNRDINIRRDDNTRNKANSLDRINLDAENKYNAVMRMLGIKGAGISSAAQMVAPHLVAQNAGNQRADQFETFGRNARGIDIAQSDSDMKYKNLFEDLLSQKSQKENDFRQSMVNQENELYGTRANLRAQLDVANGGTGSAAYQDYNDRLARNQVTLDDLVRAYAAPQYNVKAVDTNAPNLEQYTADPLAVVDPNAQDPTASEVNAYLPWLQRKEKLGLL